MAALYVRRAGRSLYETGMTTTTTRSPRKTASKAASKEKMIPQERKREILGIIMMAVALLLSLALVTYSNADSAIAQELSFDQVLHPDQRAQNALGIIGAWIARLLVPSFVGYNILILSGLVLIWGYVVFRGRKSAQLPFFSVLGIVLAFVSACIFGWFSYALEVNLEVWSGIWGLGTAKWLNHVFGAAGSLILLLLTLTILVLVAVNGDIQRTMDRVEGAFLGARSSISEWWAERRARRTEHKNERGLELRKWDELPRGGDGAGIRAERPEKAKKNIPAPQETSVRPEKNDNKFWRKAEKSDEEPESSPSAGGIFRSTVPRPTAPAPAAPVQQLKPREEGGPQPELKIQARVEEERTDFIERDTDIPEQDEHLSYTFPSIDLLIQAKSDEQQIDFEELEENKQVLLEKLETYNIEITDINAIVGPTVTMYELTPAPGVKISRITSLADDLAMAMAARGIRMIAPIPGKSAIGVEIPNRHREMVCVRDLLGTTKFRDAKMELPVAIGKSVEGEVFIEDLTKMPHLLIAGATGSGKSVGVNTLITGLLYACHPANLKFVMIDPKKIELQQYARIIGHYGAMSPITDDPIITDFTQALGVLKSCEKEMERRYDILSKATVRGVKDYNKKVASGQLKAEDGHEHLPYIVVIVDELADLMMTAGKDIEGPIARLAQMARAVGIHLVLATQRPSVDVITGLIKANFPSRMAYQVASKVDSRTILDQNGAEGLVGNGDLLYMNGSRMVRLQGPFISVDEVDEITKFIESQPGPGPYMLPDIEETPTLDMDFGSIDDIDDLFEDAARIIVRSQQGSVSLLQRKLSVGYTRAARIVDQLEEAGIVGPFEGSKARAVLVESDMQLDEILNSQKG